MSVNSKMTAIADPVRTLMGSSGKIGLDAMANHLGNAVTEVDNQNGIIQELKNAIAENVSKTSNEVSEQTELIQQIKTALEGKAGGGTVLPTLTSPGTAEDLAQGKQLIDASGKVVTGNVIVEDEELHCDYSGIEHFSIEGTIAPYCILENDVLLRAGTWPFIHVPLSAYGNATAADVAKGKTFTSADGLAVEGTGTMGGGSATDLRLANLVADTLIELDDDTVVTARAYAFYNVKNLQSVKLSNLTSAGSYIFSDCTSLISADLPNLSTSTGTYCFNGCENLTQVNLPKISAVSNYTFSDCTALEKVELGQITSLGSYSFRRAGISTLIIRNTTTITKLNSTNAFSETPIANGEGYIYFYREYVDRYKAATGWSNFAEQIRAIEDYPEITGG